MAKNNVAKDPMREYATRKVNEINYLSMPDLIPKAPKAGLFGKKPSEAYQSYQGQIDQLVSTIQEIQGQGNLRVAHYLDIMMTGSDEHMKMVPENFQRLLDSGLRTELQPNQSIQSIQKKEIKEQNLRDIRGFGGGDISAEAWSKGHSDLLNSTDPKIKGLAEGVLNTNSIEEELSALTMLHLTTKVPLKTLLHDAPKFGQLNSDNQKNIIERIEKTVTSMPAALPENVAMVASNPQESIPLKVALIGTEAENDRYRKGFSQALEGIGAPEMAKQVMEGKFLELATLSEGEKAVFLGKVQAAHGDKDQILAICNNESIRVCKNGIDLIQCGYLSPPAMKASRSMETALNVKIDNITETKTMEPTKKAEASPAAPRKESLSNTGQQEHPAEQPRERSNGLSRKKNLAVRGKPTPTEEGPSTNLTSNAATLPLKGSHLGSTRT